MKVKKKVIGQLEKCYALAMLDYRQKKHLLVAAEKVDKCLMFGLDGALEETVWEEPGGVMSMVRLPGESGAFLATHKFYSPNDSADAKIIVAQPEENGGWQVRTLVPLPFVHRFDILQGGGKNYLIACTLKSGHQYKDDFSSPGKVYAAVLPDDLTPYDEAHPLPLQVISGQDSFCYTRNHGYYREKEGPCSSAVISCDGGVFRYTAPKEEGGQWKIERLLDTPASDAALIDLDGDGEKELFVMSPFHGDTASIYRKSGQSFRKVYEYPEKLEFLHAVYAGSINGIPTVIAGHRKGKRQLIAFRADGRGGFLTEVLDENTGAANVLHFSEKGKEFLLAANREINEIAIYQIIEDKIGEK